jgi:hypothetical protein
MDPTKANVMPLQKPRPPPSLKKGFGAVNPAETAVIEENKKIIGRIVSNDKALLDGGRPRYTYDHDGRIMLVKKTAEKHSTSGVRAKIVDVIEPQTQPGMRSMASKTPASRKGAPKSLSRLPNNQNGDANDRMYIMYIMEASCASFCTCVGTANEKDDNATYIHDSTLDIPSLVREKFTCHFV